MRIASLTPLVSALVSAHGGAVDLFWSPRASVFPLRFVRDFGILAVVMRRACNLLLALTLPLSALPALAEGSLTNAVATPSSTTLKAETFRPKTLAELLAAPPDQVDKVDIAVMNLLCAEGLRGAEGLDVEFYLRTLDGWVRRVDAETSRNFHRFAENPKEYNDSLAYYRMIMLATVLQEDFGALYNPKRAEPQLRGELEPNDVFFADSKDVFLHGLLGGNHLGTCSSLPVLYLVVAQRLGYPVTLASAKGHFYIRYEDGPEHLNVEATSLGFTTHPDEFYRHWPQAISDDEVRAYGLLRPMTKAEILGAFLTIRAGTLASMKQFADAANAWKQAARFLPNTPILKQLVARAVARADNERDAKRWDDLWDQVAALEVRPDADYSYFRDRQLRLRMFMNQTTNLVAIEKAVGDLKAELKSHRQLAMLNSDAPASVSSTSPAQPLADRHAASPAPDLPSPRRVRIPAERVPPEYWRSIPTELQDRLRGLTREEDIVTEMWAFNAEELYHENKEAAARFAAKPTSQPLPPNVRPEWLPVEYRTETPAELRTRLAGLSSQAQVEWTARQFQQEQQIRRQTEEMKREIARQNDAISRLTGPPVQIEIIPTDKGTP